MDIIDFQNVSAGYSDKTVLYNINLNIKQGENWAILGANGSGKSTLMKLIQSEIHPRLGSNFKKEIFGQSRYSIFELKNKLGIISNDLHNYFYDKAPFLTAYEVVLSGYYSSIGIFKHQDFSSLQHDRALETLSFLEIQHLKDKKIRTMSTGELRKCIIARALIHKPKAFILDEPTVGLDIKTQINFLNMLKKISKHSSIILVTHHIEEIFEEITNVALIYNQTIYLSGKKEDILTSKNLSQIFEINLKVNQIKGRYFIESV